MDFVFRNPRFIPKSPKTGKPVADIRMRLSIDGDIFEFFSKGTDSNMCWKKVGSSGCAKGGTTVHISHENRDSELAWARMHAVLSIKHGIPRLFWEDLRRNNPAGSKPQLVVDEMNRLKDADNLILSNDMRCCAVKTVLAAIKYVSSLFLFYLFFALIFAYDAWLHVYVVITIYIFFQSPRNMYSPALSFIPDPHPLTCPFLFFFGHSGL